MSNDGPKIQIDHYDLNLSVVGGDQDTLEDVEETFDEKLGEAVERDPKLGEDIDEHVSREVQ
ncbi:hypothetical protein C482_15281 [Natrialba chahannaoensis JCM 10990]|uniref:Uncharacterized protein n=1 Tax=Natrialba chahannaoensis JCM 10990 TaxID=1227492 RepID=M0ADX6_9EURY|nr:hypothetical protein [Natrialba chahannaoensis]ELY96749.1 hypothetical protein C482_15281 [Natrialba chahannaoensis JCM 10990]